MSLLFMDGFDHYSATLPIERKWDPGSTMTQAGQTGRYAGYSMRQANATCNKTLPGNYSTLVVGFAFKVDDWYTTQAFFRFNDGTTEQCNFILNSSGNLVFRRGTTVLATSTYVIPKLLWIYVEFKVTIHNTTGTCEVRFNGFGTPDINATGLNTRAGSNNYANKIVVTYGSNAGSFYYDDLYVCDTGGSAPQNDFLGECKISTMVPDADGATNNFSRSSGVTNFSLVNEAFADTTGYTFSSNPGDIDLYTFGNLPSTVGTIYGVQTNIYNRKDDTGSRDIRPVVRISSTNYEGTTYQVLSDWTFASQIYTLSPATSSPWIKSEIDGAQFGIKIQA